MQRLITAAVLTGLVSSATFAHPTTARAMPDAQKPAAVSSPMSRPLQSLIYAQLRQRSGVAADVATELVGELNALNANTYPETVLRIEETYGPTGVDSGIVCVELIALAARVGASEASPGGMRDRMYDLGYEAGVSPDVLDRAVRDVGNVDQKGQLLAAAFALEELVRVLPDLRKGQVSSYYGSSLYDLLELRRRQVGPILEQLKWQEQVLGVPGMTEALMRELNLASSDYLRNLARMICSF